MPKILFYILFLNFCILLKANDKYIILQLKPKNLTQLVGLNKIYEKENFDFWKSPTQINAPIDVFLTPETKIHFMHLISKLGLDYKVLVSDVVDFIDKKEMQVDERRKHFLLNRENLMIRNDDTRFNNFGLTMGEYHSYEEIVNWMKRIEQRHNNFVKVISIGKTFEGRDIYGIIMGKSLEDTSKKIIWIDSGIHAREWAAIHTGIYTIHLIVNSYGEDQLITDYLNKLNIVIFPVLNPDGYEYTRTEPRNPVVRFWRKNRGLLRCGDNDKIKSCCKGVDLNRNFDYKFSQAGTSFDPCSEIYHGSGPFSEPESQAIRDAIIRGEFEGRIEAMISLHAYSQLFIYPYSIAKNVYPENYSDLRRVASNAVMAIKKMYGTKYQFGTGPELIYPYTGGSTDWAKEVAKIQYTYTIEVRPTYFDWNGFILDQKQLIPVGKETWEGMKVVIDEIIKQINKEKLKNEPFKLNISPEKCKDFNLSCKVWVDNQKDICKKALKAMSEQCPRSCNFCSAN
uniref:ShKT domain-containing protein n=1 Tax=Parastrongyloides trichosuri TaxID=131310 RepID=A0A0N4Z0I3_PARTI